MRRGRAVRYGRGADLEVHPDAGQSLQRPGGVSLPSGEEAKAVQWPRACLNVAAKDARKQGGARLQVSMPRRQRAEASQPARRGSQRGV